MGSSINVRDQVSHPYKTTDRMKYESKEKHTKKEEKTNERKKGNKTKKMIIYRHRNVFFMIFVLGFNKSGKLSSKFEYPGFRWYKQQNLQ
jgi:preprotein translocase subunit Sec63